MILRPLVLLYLVCAPLLSLSQTYSISGRTVDAGDMSALIGVAVTCTKTTDTTIRTGMVTDVFGNFEFGEISAGRYLLVFNYMGYRSVSQTITIADKNVVLNLVKMKSNDTKLKEVTVTGKQIRAEQKGDTSQFNADAYKTNPDATAEDLVTKMPGVTSDNSGVKVNGEAVQQVYVDGKPFFGTDPTLALKNLPSEIIDKIQVFDKLSDQAQFTGFDDGNTQKTINIITKRNMSAGTFGKIYAGYGTDDRYIAGGNLNSFKGDTRLSVIGLSNNINQQNFSADDILGITGGGGGRNRGGGGRGGNSGGPGYGGGNNFSVGQQNGITTTNSFGFNYTDNITKKLKFTGSYFYNGTNNSTNSDITRNYFSTSDTDNVYNEDDNTTSRNLNHRANMKFEYTIDSFNSITFTPGFSYQDNRSTNGTSAVDSLGEFISSRTNNNNTANNKGYNSTNNLLIQHRFSKPRRTISLNISANANEKTGDGSYYSLNNFYNPDTANLRDQHYGLYSNGYSVSPNVTYTEPIGRRGQIMANYNPSVARSSSDKQTFDTAAGTHEYSVLDPFYSNTYNTTYTAHKGGLSYRIGEHKANFTIGANVQYANLQGNEIFPHSFSIQRNFTDILPTATFNYRYSDGRNLRVMYRTNTSAPTVSQLQNVLDVSNPLLLKTGNANLNQTYEQTVIVRYGNTRATTGKNLFLNLYVNYVNNYIANSSIIPNAPYHYTDDFTKDTVLINRGSQLTRPVNMDGFWNTRSFITYGLPLGFIKSNLNINGGFNFTRTPGQVNFITNYSSNYTPSFGIVLSSNVSKELDFTLSYTGNYNFVSNTTQPQANNDYYNHTASFKINWLFLDHFVFNTSIADNYYTAFSGTGDQNFILWNAYLGYKMLKNKALEARISAYDILNQNKSISRTVTETYVENNITQVLQQYFMLQLTYTLRPPKGTTPPPPSDDGGRPSWRDHMH